MSRLDDRTPPRHPLARPMQWLAGLAGAALAGAVLLPPIGASAGVTTVAAVRPAAEAVAAGASATGTVVPPAPVDTARGLSPGDAPRPASTPDARDDADPPAARSTSAKESGGPHRYQLRCWQYGRLLFDEGPVTLPADARKAARVVAYDRQGAPLIVSEAGGSTTCLARPAAPAPNLALPR